jgi:hypothetical protein
MFSVLVDYSTHDDLRDGIARLDTLLVTVLADSPVDATLVAAQMVACTHGMPTRTQIVRTA